MAKGLRSPIRLRLTRWEVIVKIIKPSVLIALCILSTSLLSGCRNNPAGAQQPVAEYHDVGTAADFDKNQNIYFDKDSSFGGSGWPLYWNLTSPQNPGVFYEDAPSFWWVTAPPAGASSVIGARAVKLHHYARFRVRATKFSASGNLYLTLRFKDDLLAPVPVFSWNGNDWTQLGTIGGLRDHRWKTQQLAVAEAARQRDGSTYVFKIGVDQYNAAMKGELLIDQIKLANNVGHSEFPPDIPGLWPTLPKSNFSNIGQTMEFVPGEGPFFPFGVYDDTWFTDGGSPAKAGQGKKDSWRILEEAGMNCYVIHGWEQNWGSRWDTFPDEPSTQWSKPALFVRPGLKEHLAQAAAHHLKVIPNFLTDTRAAWIKGTYQNEAKALTVLGDVMAKYDNDPNLLMWYPVDEWDHEDDSYGKPHLYSHLLYNTLHKRSPHRPGFLLCMGFLGTDTWKLAAEDGDVLGVDVYPADNEPFDKGLSNQAQRLNEIRSVVGRTKPYILVPELWQADTKPLTPAQVVAQAYVGIVHGARGILYFRYGHPADPKVSPRLWDGVKQMGQELFGPTGIAKLLLPPSKPIDFLGESKVVACSNPAIHASLFQDAQGHRTLIALNMKNSPIKGVNFTIAGLASSTVKVRFEPNRVLSARNGSFTDDFDQIQRHVYDLGS